MFLDLFLFKPFGVDIFCLGKKFLVYNMVSRNLKLKYHRSFVGIFWTLLSPIAMGFIYYFVFKMILQVKLPHYLAFVMSGVLPWAFFSQTLAEGMESIVGNWGLLSKVPVPVQVFPYVNALTNLSTLFLSIPVLLVAAWVSNVELSASVFLLPFLFLALFFITYFLSLSLGILFVYLRDLRHLLGIVLQLWFYGTPVLYDESMIPQKFHWVLNANPIAHIFTSIHKILVAGTWPTSTDIWIIVAWALAIFMCGALTQKYLGHEIVEKI